MILEDNFTFPTYKSLYNSGGFIPAKQNESDLIELGWIPDEYVNPDTGKVNWTAVKKDADAVRAARQVARGQEILNAQLPEEGGTQ